MKMKHLVQMKFPIALFTVKLTKLKPVNIVTQCTIKKMENVFSLLIVQFKIQKINYANIVLINTMENFANK